MTPLKPETLVKLRDAFALAMDALQDELEGMAPASVKQETAAKEEKLDFDKLFWEKKQGEKGPFEQTSEKANGNCDLWKALKAKLKEHQGFWQSQDFKFWFDMNHEDVVDRRKSA